MKKGNKPDFHQSASGDKAKTLYEAFYNKVGELYSKDKVKNGVFAAMMDVALVNDGPVCSDHSWLGQRVHSCSYSLAGIVFHKRSLTELIRLPSKSIQSHRD